MKIKCKGGVLHPAQLEIANEIIKSNAMYHTVVTSRQFGKSFLAIQLLLYFALNNSNTKVMFCTPVYSQAQKVFKELLNGIRNSGLIKKFNAAENSIIFVNETELYFKSVKIADNLRGLSIDYLIADEAAMYNPEVFAAVLRPMLLVRGKKCILFSTPKGINFFNELYNKGLDENEIRYKSYHKTWRDNPFANLEEIEDARLTLPENLFKQEYEAEFIRDGGSVFQNVSKIATLTKWQEPIAGETYYAGIDIALQGDYFVMTILNSKREVVYCFRDTKKQMSFMLSEIDKLFKKYNPRCTLVETNGIGAGIFEFISKLHKSVTPFNTSNSSKQTIIENMIYDIQEERIHIPSFEFFPQFTNEFNTFTFKYSPQSRKVIYGAEPGAHDDIVMATAIANEALKHGATKGQYYIY